MIARIIEKMIVFSDGNTHDIDHFFRVWTFAKTIGELEGLDEDTQLILEIAAIIHDIACPLCREKYGNTNGKYQETEGSAMVRPFLEEFGIDDRYVERIEYLVGHHHTFNSIDGIDYQILIESDYIANASENNYTESNVRSFIDRIMKTENGIRIAKEILMKKQTANTEKLKEAITDCCAAGDKVLNQEAGGEKYKQELLHLLEIMKTITADDIKAAGYPANIQNTLLMDRHLIDDTVTEELDQLSLLSTVVTYISCNSEGRPGHNAEYMDRVTALRKVIEEIYGTEAMRFCGRDGC